MSAEEIIAEANSINKPNAGIRALVKKSWCIMDEECCQFPYKNEGGCLDCKKCDNENYMLACLASRNSVQLAPWTIETYNAAMENISI